MSCRDCFFHVQELNSFRSFCGNKEILERNDFGLYDLKYLERERIDAGCPYWNKSEKWFYVYNFNFNTGELK